VPEGLGFTLRQLAVPSTTQGLKDTFVEHEKETENVKLSLVINEALRIADVWGSGGVVPRNLTSVVNGDVLLASRLGCFTPEERLRAENSNVYNTITKAA
jgi:hypothetical protein